VEKKFREKEEIAKRDHEEKMRQLAQSYAEDPTTLFPWLREENNTTRGVVLSKEDEDQMVGEKEGLEKQEKEAPIPSEIPMKKEEVMRVYKPKAPYPQRLLRVTKEHANSLPKKAMQDLTKERKENNQGSPHSNEVESCMEDDLVEPSIQEVLDEEDTPTITQHLCLAIKEVKAIKESTQRRIMTKKQKTTSMKKRRSTKSNPNPIPTSKRNQANNNKRKLAGRQLTQGASIFSSSPLKSFLLTNWKKRNKIQEPTCQANDTKRALVGRQPNLW